MTAFFMKNTVKAVILFKPVVPIHIFLHRRTAFI